MLKTVGNPSSRYGDQTIIDGNLVIGTSGKGIDFSATPGTGTSELLSDYEEGTWTPINNYVTLTVNAAQYTKVGRLVYASFDVTFPVNAQGNLAEIMGLPYGVNGTVKTASVTWTDYGSALFLTAEYYTGGPLYNTAGAGVTNANLSGKRVVGMYVYNN